MLIRCKKRLADFIEEKGSTWIFRNSQKDQPTTHVNHHSMRPVILPPTTPDIVRPFTSITQDLTVGTSWKCADSADGNTWNLMEYSGIFGLSDVTWSSNSKIMLESFRRMYWKFLEMSA